MQEADVYVHQINNIAGIALKDLTLKPPPLTPKKIRDPGQVHDPEEEEGGGVRRRKKRKEEEEEGRRRRKEKKRGGGERKEGRRRKEDAGRVMNLTRTSNFLGVRGGGFKVKML